MTHQTETDASRILASRQHSHGAAQSPAANKLPSSRAGAAAVASLAPRRLHRKQAAAYLGLSLSWLDKARLKGDGPVYLQLGSRVVYDTSDLDQFMALCRRQSTSHGR